MKLFSTTFLSVLQGNIPPSAIKILLFLISLHSQLYAQEKQFTITGKPIVTVFANYHTGLGEANKESGFELERCYLGYQFKVMPHLSGRIVFDIGPTKVKGSDLERVAYIKNAMLTWTPGNFTLDFGLVKTEQFSLQENFWGYRYIFKSFDDEYKFSPSADMGIIAKYKFSDQFEADISVTNGEGYKKINQDNSYRYGAGMTLYPLSGIVIRTYYDLYSGKSDTTSHQHSLTVFTGYKHTRFYLGAEYNKMFNAGFQTHTTQSGYSVFASAGISKKISAFARYDNLETNRHSTTGNDGQLILGGIQYTPVKYLKLSPNFRNWNPYNGPSQAYLYFNLEFKL